MQGCVHGFLGPGFNSWEWYLYLNSALKPRQWAMFVGGKVVWDCVPVVTSSGTQLKEKVEVVVVLLL